MLSIKCFIYKLKFLNNFRDGEFVFDMNERKADTIVNFMKE